MTDELTGPRKAAVLLLQMSRQESTRVLSRMQEAEIEQLSAEIVHLGTVSDDVSNAVLDEFHALVGAGASRRGAQGGLELATELLISTLGPERAGAIVQRIGAAALEVPFSFLRRADPRQLLSFLQDEHPQLVALVLSHVPATMASQVLAGIPAKRQSEVAHRIATMERTSPEIVRTVEQLLRRKLSSLVPTTELSSVGGVQPLVDIINRSDRSTERAILDGLAERSPELAEQIRSQMFMFEDLVAIDDRSMQLALRQVDSQELAVALKGVRADVRDKVLRNLSERAATDLADEIEVLGPVRLRTIEEAQAKIIGVVRSLEESGQIVLRRGDDDEFVD